jgi:hypothetical protein
VIELSLVERDVRVCGHGKVALAHEFADARRGHSAEMQKADAPVPVRMRPVRIEAPCN